jgi:hypothetical protein
MASKNIGLLGFMKDIGDAIQFTLKNGHITASLILTYAAIDCMASLVMPEDQKEVKREDFIGWVAKYMKSDPDQSYQYEGIDLWGARCGLMHRYSGSSKYSDREECKIFQYHNGGDHKYDPRIHKNVVYVSAPRLIGDYYEGMRSFLSDLIKDEKMKVRVERRIGNVFHVGHLKKG